MEQKIFIKGTNLIVKSGIFNPDINVTNSSSMILNNIPDIKQKEILDVGCGTGIIGIYCALNGAKKVLATDIDEKAIENTKENIITNKAQNIEVLKSNLFEKVKGKFDYIFANLPISDRHWNLGISTINLLKNFLLEVRDHLKEGGKFYFTWILEHDVQSAIRLLKENNFHFKEKIEEKFNRTWYLFEVSK